MEGLSKNMTALNGNIRFWFVGLDSERGLFPLPFLVILVLRYFFLHFRFLFSLLSIKQEDLEDHR
jgi:hypothetical protein